MDTLPQLTPEELAKRKAAESPNFLQLVNTTISDSINHPIDQTISQFMGPGGRDWFTAQRARPNDNPGVSDVSGEILGQGGKWIDQFITPQDQADMAQQQQEMQYGQSQDAQAQPAAPVTPTSYEERFKQVGQELPRQLAQVGLMSAGPVGVGLGLADSALSAYAPNKDIAAGVIAPLTLAAGMKVIPAAGKFASEVTAKSFQPGFQDLVQMGTGASEAALRNPSLLAENAIAASRVGAETVAGTALGEASRMTGQAAHGEMPTAPTIQDLAVSAVQNLMYAPLDPAVRQFHPSAQVRAEAERNSPWAVRTRVAEETLAKVNEAQTQLQKMDQSRGQRIADTHKEILSAMESGQDPTPLMEQLRSHYIEAAAAQKPTAREAGDVLMNMAQAGEQGKLSELDIAGIVNAVTGRFDEAAKLDPQSMNPLSVSGAAVSDLVQKKLLPRVSEDWIKTNFKEAYDQGLGDDRVARANLVNRIVAHYEGLLPAAMTAYKQLPVETGITKKMLDAQVEADKDVAYMQALYKLMPHMKGKKDPSGKELDATILNRDIEYSSATQGQQLQAESAAWGTYDSWKDSIIRLADTYDPVTRTGEFVPSRRMADGEVVTGEPTRISLEDLAQREGDKGRYKINVSPTRRIDRPGQSAALSDAIEFVNERFKPLDTEDLDNPELAQQLSEKATGIKTGEKGDRAGELNVEDTTKQDTIDATREADAAGLTGEEKAAYITKTIEELSQANQPALGIDLQATDKPEFYDIGLWLMNKVEKSDNLQLWNQYGGKQVFGQGALRPGKAALFKDAIQAKLEHDMDGSGQLTAAQTRFYEGWRKYADQAEGKVSELGKSWAEQKKQFDHALRLYWRQVPRFDDFFMKMLDKKPQYQEMLRGGKPQGAAALPPLTSVDPSGSYMQRFGQINPQIDALRLFRGYARDIGYNAEDADRFGLLAHNMSKAFDETGALGRLEAPGRMQGVNFGLVNSQNVVGIDLIGIMNHEPNMTQQAVTGLQVLAHELAHNYTDLPDGPARSAYRQQRIDAYAKMAGLFNDLGPDAANDLLNRVLPEVFVPEKYRDMSKREITQPHQKFDAEAISRLMEMTMLGSFTRSSPYHGEAKRGANEAWDAFRWLPDDVQAFQRLAFRDLSNYVGALEKYYDTKMGIFGRFTDAGKDAAKTKAFLRPLLDYAEQFLDTTGKDLAEYEAIGKSHIAALNAAGTRDWTDPIVTYAPERLDMKTMHEISQFNKISFATPKGEDPYGVKEQQLEMFGPPIAEPDLRLAHEKRMGVTVPPWSRYMGQTFQALLRYERAGAPIAEHVARVMNQLEPSFWRLTQELHAPFTLVDKNGLIKEDPNHPVQLLLKGKHPESNLGLKAIETLRLWAVDNQKPVVAKDAMGKTVVTEDAKSLVDSTIGKLSPAIQQGILEGMYSLTDGYRRAAEMRYSSEIESVSHQVAKFFMLKDKGMNFDNAFQSAQVATNAAIEVVRAERNMESAKSALESYQKQQATQPQLMADPKAVELQQAFAGAVQQLKQTRLGYAQASDFLSPDQAAVMENYVFGQAGAAQGLVKMSEMLASRAGWFMSEQRPGRYLVYGTTPDGKQYANGKRDKGVARDLVRKLTQQGYTDLNIVDKYETDATRTFDVPDAVLNDYLKVEQSAWRNFLNTARDTLNPDDMAKLEQTGYEPGLASAKLITNRSLDRYLLPNKLTAGREDLDSFEVFDDYTRRLVGSVARKSTRQQLELVLRDPRALKNGEFQTFVREASRALMEPVGERFTKLRAGITAMFLGFPNIASPLVEMTQSQTTVVPALVNEGGSYVKGVKYFSNAPINIWKYHDAPSTMEGKKLISSARSKELAAPEKMTKEESMAYYYLRAKQEGSFSHGVAQQEMLAKDTVQLNQFSRGMGLSRSERTIGEVAGDSLYWLARKVMVPYSVASSTNNKIAFVSGLEMLYDKGFRGNELYEKAQVFKNRATYGGGKANELGFVGSWSNPKTRSYFSLVTVLQRYPFASLTQYKDLLADIRGSTNLTPGQRVAAGVAFTHAMAAQVVLGGALALPGALIAAGLLAQMGVDLKQGMRNLWVRIAKGLGADDPMAVQLANIAQNGVGGQFLGMDLSSRFAINSFMGFDSFEGWNAGSMFGAAGSTVERMVGATKYAAKGDMVKAGQQFLPPSFTPLIDIANQKSEYPNEPVGMRDASGGLIQKMSPAETIKYAANVRPYWYRQFRDLQSHKIISEQAMQETRGQKVEDAAQALNRGDNSKAFEWTRQYMQQTPSANPKDALRSVVDRALVQTNAKDLLASSTTGNEQNLQAAAATFGDAVSRQSETQLLLQREKLNALTGYAAGQPMTSKDITRAQMVDALVKSKGMTRSEAIRLVTLAGY